MNAKQQALFELLLKVKKFMDDEGIVFYLFGGSAIGALRHGGFIPWDDDIDILMDRENYYKLMLERVKQLAVSYQDNDTEGLRTILDSFTEEEKRDIPDCILAECRLMKTEDANQERLTNGIELCDAYLRKHPTNYDVLKQKGDLLFLAGDGEMARKLYSEVLRSTRNGLDILDIQKSGGKTDYC